MNNRTQQIKFQEAKSAYKKFIRESKGPFGIRLGKRSMLKKFVDVQKEFQAYNSSVLGIKNVEISQIIGSVQKYTDFDKNFVPQNSIIESRWCNIYLAFMADANLPLVQLYKIKEEYFVYDGNHRISVANFLKFKYIEAEVTEFIPSSQNKEDIIYREKFIFEKETGIDGILFSEVHQYKRLNKEIADFQVYLKEKERKEVSVKESAEMWYKNLYKPVVKILETNDMPDYFMNKNISDIFLYFLDHKYYKSELTKADVGFTYSLVDFINLLKTNADNALDNKFKLEKNHINELETLKELDRRIELDKDILFKLDTLKKVTEINFQHNFVILYEVDSYFSERGFSDYREAAQSWFEEKLLTLIYEFKIRANVLPKRYVDRIEEICQNKELIFYQLRNYEKVYEKKYKRKLTELIPNYILDIFIPLVEIIEANFPQKSEFQKIYSEIYGKYLYLFEYNRNVSLLKAAELYKTDEGLKHYKTTEWFGVSYNNKDKLKKIIINALDKMDKETAIFCRKLINEYGKLGRYETLFKIEEFYKELINEYGSTEEAEIKITVDLQKLYRQNEINIFYKTKTVMLKLQNDETYGFLDFYISILDSAKSLGKDKIYIDILDLAMDYIH